MENRFGFKDFVLMTLVVIVGILVVWQMWQADLQYKQVKKLSADLTNLSTSFAGVQRNTVAIEQQTTTLSKELAQARQQLQDLSARGVAIAANPATAAANPAPVAPTPGTAVIADPKDPFWRIKAARAMDNFQEGDWLVDNFGARVGKITPLISSDIYGATVQARTLETLLTRDPETLEYMPLLAESYQISDDGLSVTYKLRRGVVFSDGAPFTASDVTFTIERIMDPVLDAARTRSYFIDNGLKVEALDEYTVKFTLAKPYFELLSITGDLAILPRHFYSKYTAQQMNDNPGLILGSGPYRMQTPDGWRPGEPLILVRNERYWGTPPAYNRIVYREVQEDAASTVMFRNGELDILPATPQQFEQMKKDESITSRANALAYYSMLGGYTYIAWNQERAGKKTPFADVRVRRAMTLLIDRQRLADEIWLGFGQPATGPFAPGNPQADPNIKALPYDPAAAKKLLEEAGFIDRNGDGVVEDAQGNALKFEFTFPSGNEISTKVALFVKDNLAKGGVQAEIKGTDWPTLVERLTKSQFDAVTLGWASSVESDLFQIFHSSQIADGGDNRTRHSNPELDRYIELARGTVNREQRMKYWNRAHQIIHEDQPYTFLLNRQALRFFDKRITNVEKAKMGLNFMTTEVMPLPWFTPKGQHRFAN
jgi:peptide/nickel transport system substrate-binding protein